MRTLLPLLLVAGAAFGQARECYELRPVTLIDGSTVAVRVKVPCEVSARTVGVEETPAPCKKCGDSCKCVGGCGCEAAARAEAAAKVERPRAPAPEADAERYARLMRTPVMSRMVDVRTGLVVWQSWTLADHIRTGGTVDNVAGLPLSDDDKAFVRWRTQGVSAPAPPAPPVVVTHPIAVPMPVRYCPPGGG